tara:strand:+ start:120 stop:842 length:723 start_codon:yes stop_codon:yes gene_type:complete
MSSDLDITKSYNYNYNRVLKNIIPLLIERKYCYSRPVDKGTFDDTEIDPNTPRSNYNIFDQTEKPYIFKEDSTSGYQADDYLKENVINAFTSKLINQLGEYNTLATNSALNQTLTSAQTTLRGHQNNIITDLNNDLNILNNKNHNNTLLYSRKDFNKNKYIFYRNIIVNTILVFAVIFVLNSLSSGDVPLLPKDLIFYVNAVIIGVYMTYLVLLLNSVNNRNKTNWNQYNFRNIIVEEKV